MKEKIPILADRDVQYIVNGITGANQADMHLMGVNVHRDLTPDCFGDLRNALDRDPCPRCSSKLSLRHAIEVGHVFKLGTKYTDALNAKFLDADEQLKPIIMGCYGIGVNRIIAGLIETSNDKDGIIWPVSLAPYEVVLTLVKVPDEASMKVALELHDKLTAAGIDVLLDDRDCRAGVKFKDADLVGMPLARGDRRARFEGRQARSEVAMGLGRREDRHCRGLRDDFRLDSGRAPRGLAISGTPLVPNILIPPACPTTLPPCPTAPGQKQCRGGPERKPPRARGQREASRTRGKVCVARGPLACRLGNLRKPRVHYIYGLPGEGAPCGFGGLAGN